MAELTDEVRSFLGERRCAVLATHDPDGSIHLTPVWFLFEHDSFYFESSSKSREGGEHRAKLLGFGRSRCTRPGTGAMGIGIGPS
jgi:pyridoxamine 5'-phosphate oxidase-like protein